MADSSGGGNGSRPARFYGKYRGTVEENIDPMNIGRLLVQVPDVLGSVSSSWALPCFPAAGMQMGVHMIPPVGAGVWVEFEQGNPNYPIWTGCFWGQMSELPAPVLLATPGMPSIVLQTLGQSAIVISDLPGPTGGIMLKSAAGTAMVIVNDTHILITNGVASIELAGNAVMINQTALVVT